MRWVTSWGWKEPPLMPQIVFGLLASATSARTGVAAPWSLRTASCADGWPAQLAWSAAHAGTATGVGSAVGDGEGLGLGSGLGLGYGDGVGEAGVGLGSGASGPFGVQAPTAARMTRRTTPFLTLGWNDRPRGRVTRIRGSNRSPRIPVGPVRLG